MELLRGIVKEEVSLLLQVMMPVMLTEVKAYAEELQQSPSRRQGTSRPSRPSRSRSWSNSRQGMSNSRLRSTAHRMAQKMLDRLDRQTEVRGRSRDRGRR